MKPPTLQPPFTAFKEWHAICDALAHGEQHLILRKGGIAEGSDGFAFQHPQFLLFPTFFHAQYDGIQVSPESQIIKGNEVRETVTFSACCQIVAKAVLSDWKAVERLQPFHIWKNELLRERFEYGDHQALHLAVVQTFTMKSTTIPFEKRFGGCRSWVSIPLTEVSEMAPIVSDAVFQEKYKEIAIALKQNVSQP
ncbi:MAG: DUF1802 family protein [Verrucomicrobiales bacterium]